MDDFDFGKEKLVLSTHAAKQKLPAKAATVDDTGSPIWDIDEAIRLPTYDRYASALFFDCEFVGSRSWETSLTIDRRRRRRIHSRSSREQDGRHRNSLCVLFFPSQCENYT